MKLTAGDLAKLPAVEFRNAELLGRRALTGVSTDSRTVGEGDLFVALRGGNFDGHKFIAEAAARGARAAIVDGSGRPSLWPRIPLVVVQDTTRALGVLGRIVRDKVDIPVVGVAGSNGKTTTKDMMAAVLGTAFRVLSTEENYNNNIGVPKTLFRLEQNHEVAVIEMGTNHPGELGELCEILDPTHGIVTNIGREHLEFFGSVDGVAQEEGVLFDRLAERKGSLAFVNADDAAVVARSRRCRKKLSYGFTARYAQVKGSNLRLDSAACTGFRFSGKGMRAPRTVSLGVPGRHQAANALAAAAVGLALGVPPGKIAAALEAFQPPDRRMEVLTICGVTVLNDTYNANPDSTIAALETLAALHVSGKRIAVLADMLELGSTETEEHRRVGEAVSHEGIDYLLTYGMRAKHIHEAARIPFAVHYEQKNMLAEYLAELIGPGDAVLLKGSRGTRMEDIVTFLRQRLQEPVLSHQV